MTYPGRGGQQHVIPAGRAAILAGDARTNVYTAAVAVACGRCGRPIPAGEPFTRSYAPFRPVCRACRPFRPVRTGRGRPAHSDNAHSDGAGSSNTGSSSSTAIAAVGEVPRTGPILSRRGMALWPRWQESREAVRRDLERGLHPDETAGLAQLERNLAETGPVREWFAWQSTTLRCTRIAALLAGLRMQPSAVADFARSLGAQTWHQQTALAEGARQHFAAAWEREQPRVTPAPPELSPAPAPDPPETAETAEKPARPYLDRTAPKALDRVRTWLEERDLAPVLPLAAQVATELNLHPRSVQRHFETLAAP